MLHHHKQGLKQSIFAFIVVFLACTGMFLALKPDLYSSASTYVPITGTVPGFPDSDAKDSTPTFSPSKENMSKARDTYIVQPQNLPVFKVTDVIDGNTVVLEGITRVRLIGIKAPDLDEEYGTEATDFLKNLVDQKGVGFQLDDKNPIDDLGRLRGIIYIDKKNVNIEILRNGLAHIFPTTPSIVGYDDWSSFENEAREAKRGLWSGEKPKIKDTNIEKSKPML